MASRLSSSASFRVSEKKVTAQFVIQIVSFTSFLSMLSGGKSLAVSLVESLFSRDTLPSSHWPLEGSGDLGEKN